MKIGILTQPLGGNYGGLLQNYALQQVLIILGHKPVTLHWTPVSAPLYIKVLSAIKTFIYKFILHDKNRNYYYQLSSSEEEYINKNQTKFIEEHIIHTPKAKNPDELKKNAMKECIEAYVVGSDQCWRPSYCPGFVLSMFVDFDLTAKCISYAASFGVDTWEYTDGQTKSIRRLISRFDKVSVREETGVKLCNKYLDIKAQHVLDPTMLLKKEDYQKLLKHSNVKNCIGDLFCYFLDPNKSKQECARKIAKKHNYIPFDVLPKYQNENRSREAVKQHIDDCVYPSVLVWLRAFMDAKMVICDSFHGCVFSIIFNKPFWVIGNTKRGMSRFTSLLSGFGLEERLISVEDIEHLNIAKPIDWNLVNTILESKREESTNYLSAALSQ